MEVKKGYTSFLSDDVGHGENHAVHGENRVVAGHCADQVVLRIDGISRNATELGFARKWIAQFLLQHEVRRSAQRQMTGGVGPDACPSLISGDRIPVRSAEQGRIADALDELFSDLDAGVAALERVRDGS